MGRQGGRWPLWGAHLAGERPTPPISTGWPERARWAWPHNVPAGMEASSAVACMSVMGFDPAVYYAGRGPIEAMAMGIELEPGQVAMRCNLVTVVDGRHGQLLGRQHLLAEEARGAGAPPLQGRMLGRSSGCGPARRGGIPPHPDGPGRGRSACYQLHARPRRHRPAGGGLRTRGTGRRSRAGPDGAVQGHSGRTSGQRGPDRPGTAAGDPDLALLAGDEAGADAHLRRDSTGDGGRR